MELDPSLCYTRCQVGMGACATIVDPFSTINAASERLVKVLGLSRKPHLRPYTLWCINQGIQITHQVKVKFSLSGHGDVVICDVIPLEISVCSLVLGRPWTTDREWLHEYPQYARHYSYFLGNQFVRVTSYTPQQYFDDRQQHEPYVNQEKSSLVVGVQKEVKSGVPNTCLRINPLVLLLKFFLLTKHTESQRFLLMCRKTTQKRSSIYMMFMVTLPLQEPQMGYLCWRKKYRVMALLLT